MKGASTDMASQGAEREEDFSAIDIENASIPLVTSIRESIDLLPPLSPNCCIHKVPQCLQQFNEKFYTPQMVSIGPLHHGTKNLAAMEEHKLRYLHSFLHRTKLSLEYCLSKIKEWEERARSYYMETNKLDSDEFVKMVLVDSTFIIEVIWRSYFLMEENETEWMSKPIMHIDVVQTDMILLENQLPFFVLDGLFNLGFPSHPDNVNHPSFTVLSILYFEGSISLNNDFPQTIPTSDQVKHFVDLLRLCHLPSSLRPLSREGSEFVRIPTATDLQEVGLTITRRSNHQLLDIRYVKGVLEIPQFDIADQSEIVLRNLVAFEMCHHWFNSYIIDYVVFMKSLLRTASDVDILVQNGIIENGLGDSSAVATVFHNLASEVTWASFNNYYHGVSKEVDAYCKVPWHKWNAIMKHDYCSTPWRVISTTAAVSLLVLTLIQTICSIISL